MFIGCIDTTGINPFLGLKIIIIWQFGYNLQYNIMFFALKGQ